MAIADTAYRHIVLDNQGIPVIAGANTKVAELIAKIQTHGLSPEELCYQLPHLSLGQIYSALAYYWDHREDIDRDLERRSELAGRLRHELGQPPLVERLGGGLHCSARACAKACDPEELRGRVLFLPLK